MTHFLTGNITLTGRGTIGPLTNNALGSDTNIIVPRETNLTIQRYAPGISYGSPAVVTEVTNIGAYDSSVTSGMPTGYNRQCTWNNVSIGTPSSDRIVVVALGTRDTDDAYPALVTIGGETATVVNAQRPSKAHSILAWVNLTVGTTADIVVTFPGFPPSTATWGTVYTVTGAEVAATYDSDTSAVFNTTTTLTPAVVNGSAVIACSYYEDLGNTTSPTCAWSGLTEDYDVTETTNGFSSASGVMTGDDLTYDIAPTWTSASGSQDMSAAAIVFEPSGVVAVTPPPTPVPTNTVEETILDAADIQSIFTYRTSSTHPGEPSWTSGLSDGRIRLIEDPTDSSVATIRCTFLAGTRGFLQWLTDLLGDWEDVTLTFYFRFESADGSAVDFQRGGKLTGLGGGTVPTGGAGANGDGFSSRYNWIEQSLSSPDTNISAYLYDAAGDAGITRHCRLSTIDPTRTRTETQADPTSGNFDLAGDTWYKMTQRVVMNTPGVSNGIIQCWIDDVLALDTSDINWRDTSTWGISCYVFSTFFGGSDTAEWQAEKDTYIYYKGFTWTINDTGETFTIDLEGPTAVSGQGISGTFTGPPEGLSTGETLTMAQGTWSGTGTITYAYQWRRNGAPISGATSSTYTLTSADVGKTVMCTITATDDEGSRYYHDYGQFVASG